MKKRIVKTFFLCSLFAAIIAGFPGPRVFGTVARKNVQVGRCDIVFNPLADLKHGDDMLKPAEITSFLLECQYAATGLIPTEISTEGITNIHRGDVSTYAAAVAHQVLLMSGRAEEAGKMADTMRILGEKRNLPNTVDMISGLSADFYTTAGPNSFWGISFLKEYHLTKQGKWLEAAMKIADFLLSLQAIDGGIRKDSNPMHNEYRVKSTEENMDCYAFFRMLFNITGERRYERAAGKILQWLAQSGVYNRKNGFFSIGTYNNVVDPTYGLDVNTLAIVILGPEILNAEEGNCVFSGRATDEKIIENFDKALVKTDYLHPDGTEIKDVVGFDFTDVVGRGGRRELITPEFSSQAALAYMVKSVYELTGGNNQKAADYADKAKKTLENLSRIAARTDVAAALPYATVSKVRRFGFDNWFTPEAEANVSSSWIAFPLAGYNPFEIDSFKVRDSIERFAPWVVDFGNIKAAPKMFPHWIAEGTPYEIELLSYSEAVLEEEVPEKPFIYYKILYEKSLMDYLLAKSRLESALMTSYSAWVGGLVDVSELGYDTLEITESGKVIKRKFDEISSDIKEIIEEEYLYFDELSGSQWIKAVKYNLDIDYSQGANYAFAVDGDYNIIKQFRTELEVPQSNRADLKDETVEFKSARGLPEGHIIMRYFTAVELDENNRVIDAYERVDDLPGMIAKVPISEQAYRRFSEAAGEEKEKLIGSGIVPFFDGALAKKEEGNFYYTQVLALDTSRRLFSRTYSRDRGTDVVVGTRLLLADWEVDKRTKINSVKYEKGLVDGMAMTIKRPLIGEKPLKTEPLWISLGRDAINEEMKNLKSIQSDLLRQIDGEKDAQLRQSLIREFDRLNTEMFWLDDKGYLHTISYGLKGAEKLLKEIENAKIEAEASPKEYFSVLGRDLGGRDYRDVYGLVWIGVRDKASGNLLQVETYDIAGNLKFILAENVRIDPLTKNVSAETRTDILYDKNSNQMIGSHTYAIDDEGNWITDISESIYKGRTPDREHYVMKRNVFVKGKDGETVFQDGSPAHETIIDYYNMKGELEAEISGDIIAAMTYQDGSELLRDVYIDPGIKVGADRLKNLSEILKGRQWVYRFTSTGEKPTLREAIEKSLVYTAPGERRAAADVILETVNARAKEEIINTMVLEEREVTNNIPGISGDEAVSFTVYYAPGDALGRERFKVMGGRIEIPFEWIRGKP
ncbi:MAG: glycoside hydrolase family 76 protein, partial [bacterium]|nr:glycoside hydrolase family 76 protein [bacterium]